MKKFLSYIVPQTQTQREIAQIWDRIIDFFHMGSEGDFFELGVHSLLAGQLAFRVNEHFGISVPLGSVLTKDRTVPDVSEAVEELLLDNIDVEDMEELMEGLEDLSEDELLELLECEDDFDY